MSACTLYITGADDCEDSFTGENMADCFREILEVAANVPEQFPPGTLALLMDGLSQVADLYAEADNEGDYSVTVHDVMNDERFEIVLSVS